MSNKLPVVDRAENEEGQGGGGLSTSSAGCSGASGSRMGPGPDSGSSAPSSVPHSLATSRDDEDDEDEESSGRRSNGHTGTRTKSNQRWMKLRTTVQLSSAISTIQKKPPLKREDSFLKRFSTRQIPESQETLDTGEGEGDAADDKDSSGRRRRRPRRPQKPPKTVVNPDENFYYYWLMLLSGCVLYNLWTLIVRQSLPELQAVAPAAWLACDGFTDLVFFLDVAVQFRTGYLEQGLMVYNSKKLAGHYLKSKSFVLDLLALLPLDLLQVNLGSNPMLRFPRFLKIYRVYNYYYMVESRTVYPNLWRVLNLIHILLILAHWFGCFYYLLSEAEGFQGEWVYPYRPGAYATLTRKYLGSLYWSTLTLTTIGDLPTPETNAEDVPGGNPRSLARRGRLSRLLQFKHNGGYLYRFQNSNNEKTIRDHAKKKSEQIESEPKKKKEQQQ
ncbi:cyclic nucleotide-gated channel cone photoreceptor subunit alpha-like isoform X2 [Frieseomelitta varia]|uniref:cyclic nucleotide-gated channel cone photoreceptor subunit alpha-like isoform X2 n=1 Tax=Frieseomelitta varia TaxID=561572 RepID=UPI001CB68F5A|nr:cyclic nucleotide-gated channel cone photoreceptor subunit alpha-like isoform X2 [Frieseomelitta varia]